jgi:hypothetical protein
MAINKFFYKSLSDLKALAESYRTNLVQRITERTNPVYTIADVSKEEFEDISTFVFNAVIKDSKLIEQNETILSREFSSYMEKYFKGEFKIEDLISLKNFVNKYNKIAFTFQRNNQYGYTYGIRSASQGFDTDSFFEKIKTSIIKKVEYLANVYPYKSDKKTLSKWLTGTSNGEAKTYSISDFYTNYFLKSNIVDMIIVLIIISYLNSEESSQPGAFQINPIDGTITRNPSLSFENENFYDENLLNDDYKDMYFSDERAYIISEVQVEPTSTSLGQLLKLIEIRNDRMETVIKIPYALYSVNESMVETLIEKYVFLTEASISSNRISFSNLIFDLKNNLINFIKNINITNELSSISGLDTSKYISTISYFYIGTNETIFSNIFSSVSEIAKIFYNKDKILENFYINNNEEEKLEASLFEIRNSQNGNQIIFLDFKGIDFSKNNKLLNSAKELFSTTLGIQQSDEDTLIKNNLTYTVIYKELNPVLRKLCLADVQDFKLARLFGDFSYVYKNILESKREKDYSFLTETETLYRLYKEKNEVFDLDGSLNRYKFLYSNMFVARDSNESDIIGHYVGDNSTDSAFIRNYGYKEYQKYEIEKFLEIYKTTRDYYYKVLLNKSFIQEEAYFLYEKLFIAFVAMERFMSSKLENLRNPDFFNDQDVFNFLESYGLGILNQYNFFLGAKNYKVNIIKNFASLNKKKGSKDVIDLLNVMFDVGDTLVNINKFILAEEVDWTEQNKKEISLKSVKEDGEDFYSLYDDTTDLNIKIYDESRVYLHEGKFKDADGEELTLTTDYIFDEEKGKLYNRATLVELQFIRRKTTPDSDESGYSGTTIYFNEVTESFYLGETLKTYTNVSVVLEMPRALLADNSIYMISSSGKFFIRKNNTWELFKVYDYFPSIIEENYLKGNSLIRSGETYTSLLRFEGFTFSTIDSDTGNIILNRYKFNELELIPFEIVNELPKQKYVIDVSFLRVLNKLNYIPLNKGSKSSMLYYLKEGNENGNKIFLNENGLINTLFGFNISQKELMFIPEIKFSTGDLKFVEVPYTSDNGSRELNNNLSSGTKYNSFLEINESQKIDPYWTKENVPEEDLIDIGIDSVETKYLSLTISENVYRRYAISRYILSAIEYLDSFIIQNNIPGQVGKSVVDRIEIDSGQSLFGQTSIYNYYRVIKILFKTVLRLFEEKTQDRLNTPKTTSFTKFYGINPNYNWNSLITFLSGKITNFNSIKDEFLSEDVRKNATIEKFDKFNLYEKTTNNWLELEYDLDYREDKLDFTGELKKYNTVATLLKDSLFSNIKLNPVIAQENSGEYILNTLENLNLIRISASKVESGTPIASKNDNLWNYFLSKYFNAKYTNIDPLIYQTQKSQFLPTKEELYFKITSLLVKFPIEYFDGILNNSYPNVENINRNKNFMDMMKIIFENVYMVDGVKAWKEIKVIISEAPPSGLKVGEHWYDEIAEELKVRTISDWSVVDFQTDNVITSGTAYGSLYLNEEDEQLFVLIAEDPAMVADLNTSTLNSSITTYLGESLVILNGSRDLSILTGTEIDELIETYSEKLISVLGSLESVFASETFMQILFSLNVNEQRTLGFVETAIKIFISYTTQLYSSRFIREYKTPSESPFLHEDLKHKIFQNRADYVFLDEKLEIRKEE